MRNASANNIEKKATMIFVKMELGCEVYFILMKKASAGWLNTNFNISVE